MPTDCFEKWRKEEDKDKSLNDDLRIFWNLIAEPVLVMAGIVIGVIIFIKVI